MSMMQTYKNITERHDGKPQIQGHEFTVKQDISNEYHKDQLPMIPEGTIIVADFAGDFGMYGMAEINGAIHRVKVDLTDLHKIDFGIFDARNNAAA